MPRGVSFEKGVSKKRANMINKKHGSNASGAQDAYKLWSAAQKAAGKPVSMRSMVTDASRTTKKVAHSVKDYGAIPAKKRAKADLAGYDTKGSMGYSRKAKKTRRISREV